MGKIERLIIYTVLAVMALATFSNRGLIWAQGKPEEATFRKVTIVDDAGKRRAEMGTSMIGPVLSFFDDVGKRRAVLDVSMGGPELVLFDEKGRRRAVLAVLMDGPELSFYDDALTRRAVLGSTSLEATKTGTVRKRSPSSLILFDKDGKIIWHTPQD